MDPRTALIVSIAQPTAERMLAASSEPVRRGCWVEFRLDALGADSATELQAACRVLSAVGSRAVFTLRSREQGGFRAQELPSRVRCWRAILSEPSLAPHYLDWEVDLALEMERSGIELPWERIIVSDHRYVPGALGLEEAYARTTAFPAAVSKIAFTPGATADCAVAFSLLERARSDGRKLVMVAMGPRGASTRILAPAFDAFATYASLSEEVPVAPGQIPYEDLVSRYRFTEIDSTFTITGIVGNPVGHSSSPAIHNEVYREEGIDWVYVPFEVDDLPLFVRRMADPKTREMRWNLRGLSVTIPHKVTAATLVDEVDEQARRVGAINTVSIEGDRLRGFNTDVWGIIEPIRQRMDPRSKLAIVIGAGGAAAAACVALKDAGANVRLLSRNRGRAERLALRLGVGFGEFEEVVGESYDVMINATPVGMEGYPDRQFHPDFAPSPGSLIFDLVYNPLETPLLAKARARGCHTISGIEMLIEQAARQHEIWTGARPNREVMMRAATEFLSSRP